MDDVKPKKATEWIQKLTSAVKMTEMPTHLSSGLKSNYSEELINMKDILFFFLAIGIM